MSPDKKYRMMINFEQILHIRLMSFLVNLNKLMPVYDVMHLRNISKLVS